MGRFAKLQLILGLASLLLCSLPVPAQTPNPTTIETGKIIDRVVIQAKPDQSYALFLPTAYTPDKAWPTVFCLDPRARGKIALERFVPAAEKHGYVIVCSNNSRNGLDSSTISQIFTDFWADVHARFNIDEKRTYAAGFSGGSRLSTTFASRCRGCLAGVVGSGAGFPSDTAPDDKTTFAYFGIVGVDDFNFEEMSQLERKLAKLPAPYHFENFSGGHEWPPPETLERALAWLSLQAFKSSSAPKDNKFVQEQWNIRMNRAEQLLAGQQYAASFQEFTSIVRDFRDLRDVKAAIEKSDQLSKSSELKRQFKAEDDLYQRQLREAGEIRMLWMKAPDPDESRSSRVDAASRISELRKKKELPDDNNERRLARRILSHLLIEAFESSQAALRNNDHTNALANYQLAREVDPKNPGIQFELARVYALKRQKKSALDSLEEAVSLGFKDVNRLKSEEAFSTLTEEPRYQKLLSRLTSQ